MSQSPGLCPEMRTAMKWIGKCQKLAYTWQISWDPLRRHQVRLLYSSGHDRLAEEVHLIIQQLHLSCCQSLIVN